MSYLYITEFEYFIRDINVPVTPPVAEQQLEIGLVPVSSEPFKGKFILVSAHAPAALGFGADANPKYHVLSGDRYYGVNPGSFLSVVAPEE